MSDQSLPPSQSAYLNLGQAAKDCETAREYWEDDNIPDAIRWAIFARDQIDAAIAKLGGGATALDTDAGRG